MSELTVYEHQAACPYCGQMMFVVLTTPNPTKEERNTEALEKCSCRRVAQISDLTDAVALQGRLGNPN